MIGVHSTIGMLSDDFWERWKALQKNKKVLTAAVSICRYGCIWLFIRGKKKGGGGRRVHNKTFRIDWAQSTEKRVKTYIITTSFLSLFEMFLWFSFSNFTTKAWSPADVNSFPASFCFTIQACSVYLEAFKLSSKHNLHQF